MLRLAFSVLYVVGLGVFHFGIVPYVSKVVSDDDVAVQIGMVLENTLFLFGSNAYVEI